jgi:hypothetical protein
MLSYNSVAPAPLYLSKRRDTTQIRPQCLRDMNETDAYGPRVEGNKATNRWKVEPVPKGRKSNKSADFAASARG